MPDNYVLQLVLNEAEKRVLEKLAACRGVSIELLVRQMIEESLISYGLVKWEPTPDQMALKIFQTASDL